MVQGALGSVRVLDLSGDIAGSFCARLLGDYGADVIKVEPPGGAPLRRMGPFFEDDPHPEKSLLFFRPQPEQAGRYAGRGAGGRAPGLQ